MAVSRTDSLLGFVRELAQTQATRGLADQELLGRFLSQTDATAFEALVRRHGPMVFRVCRRVLQSDHDAEDAFQATFLVLAKKAGAVRRAESVGSWLFGVASRLASSMKKSLARRRVRERHATERRAEGVPAEISVREAQQILDEEVLRLREIYQAPFVLCCLEGMTRDEAARRLGVPVATLRVRLKRARHLLRGRLARRGLTVSGALLGWALAGDTATAAVPPALAAATVQAAMTIAAGGAAATVVSAKVAVLTDGVMKAMLWNKLKVASAALLSVVLLGLGLGQVGLGQVGLGQVGLGQVGLGQVGLGQVTGPSRVAAQPDGVPAAVTTPNVVKEKPPVPADTDLAGLQGTWHIVSERHNGQEKWGPHFESYTFTFKGNDWTTAWVRDDGTAGGGTSQFVIDPAKKPRELTITGKNLQILAIYTLDKDQLTVAHFGRPQNARPLSFNHLEAGGGEPILMVRRLKREPQAK